MLGDGVERLLPVTCNQSDSAVGKPLSKRGSYIRAQVAHFKINLNLTFFFADTKNNPICNAKPCYDLNAEFCDPLHA